jgi:hypothetical protein
MQAYYTNCKFTARSVYIVEAVGVVYGYLIKAERKTQKSKLQCLRKKERKLKRGLEECEGRNRVLRVLWRVVGRRPDSHP